MRNIDGREAVLVPIGGVKARRESLQTQLFFFPRLFCVLVLLPIVTNDPTADAPLGRCGVNGDDTGMSTE